MLCHDIGERKQSENPEPKNVYPIVEKSVRDGNINKPVFRGSTPLEYACISGDYYSVLYLLQCGAVCFPRTLLAAACQGNEYIVEALFENEITTDFLTREGKNAAHCAASHGFLEVLKVLHSNGVDLYKKDINQKSLEDWW